MKYIFLFIAVFIVCSCEDSLQLDERTQLTRNINNNDIIYSFGIYGGAEADEYQYDYKGNLATSPLPAISSYKKISEQIIPIIPEIISKPEWVNGITYKETAYEGMYSCDISLAVNSSAEEKKGQIILRQPESDKRLSFNVIQRSSYNKVLIQVEEVVKNRFLIKASTTYPVESLVKIDIYITGYNKGGELRQTGQIDILEGEKQGSSIIEFNGTPLVYYHGDLDGYEVEKGSISENDLYQYSYY